MQQSIEFIHKNLRHADYKYQLISQSIYIILMKAQYKYFITYYYCCLFIISINLP